MTQDYKEISVAAKVDESLRQKLSVRLRTVVSILEDRQWHTAEDLAARLGCPVPGLSAQIRDLRKPKYGGLLIEGRRFDDGSFRYQLQGQSKKPIAPPQPKLFP